MRRYWFAQCKAPILFMSWKVILAHSQKRGSHRMGSWWRLPRWMEPCVYRIYNKVILFIHSIMEMRLELFVLRKKIVESFPVPKTVSYACGTCGPG